MIYKNLSYLIIIIFFGQPLLAQKIFLQPSLSLRVFNSHLQNKSIEEPVLGAGTGLDGEVGLSLYDRISGRRAIFFRFSSFSLSTALKGIQAEKTTVTDPFFDGANSLLSTPCVSFGLGYQYRFTPVRGNLNSAIEFDINVNILSRSDTTFGNGGRLDGRFDIFKRINFERQNKFTPSIGVAYQRNFYRKKGKYFFAVRTRFEFSPSKAIFYKVDYYGINPRTLAPFSATAELYTKVQGISISILKPITIKR